MSNHAEEKIIDLLEKILAEMKKQNQPIFATNDPIGSGGGEGEERP